jgi:hypothetical protein
MDTPGTPDPSPSELAQLRRDVAEVKDALAKLANASTPAAKERAADDVDDAEQDLAKTARKLGLPVERYKAAVAAARRQAFDDEYGSAIDARVDAALERLLADDGDDDGDGDDAGDDDKPPPAKKKRQSSSSSPDGDAGDDSPPPPAGDSDPKVPHWSEKPLRELIG